MSVASRLASLFLPNNQTPHFVTEPPSSPSYPHGAADTQRSRAASGTETIADMEEETETRYPLRNCMLAGGLGGTTGDMTLHSLDTVKTRQQGDVSIPPRYPTTSTAYARILREEGLARGLYAGVAPAFLGSFSGTIIFFGTYEASKRYLLERHLDPWLAYLSAGFIADLAASPLYVPSEVLKTRLQLQGRYNNPHFRSGYNYRGTMDALRTIVRTEGVAALFQGYKATIARDLPFSALQFAFYEQEQALARRWAGGRDIGLGLEVLTATTAGGLAGVLTCPLDVVKTRVQTAVQPAASAATAVAPATLAKACARKVRRAAPGPQTEPELATASILRGLVLLYRQEGLWGWFRGVGPRAVWTSIQSGVMLVCYQALLRRMDRSQLWTRDGPAPA